MQIAAAAVPREESLQAHLRNVGSVIGDDEFREVIFVEPSTTRWALAAVLEMRVGAFFGRGGNNGRDECGRREMSRTASFVVKNRSNGNMPRRPFRHDVV